MHKRRAATRLGITGPRWLAIGQHHGMARGVIPHPVPVVNGHDDERRDRRIQSGTQRLGDARDLQQKFLSIEQIEHGKALLRLPFIVLWQIDAVLPRLIEHGRVMSKALGIVEHVCLGRRETEHSE
ncbi:hypothetical protein D3C77_581340 [compost metagenome]